MCVAATAGGDTQTTHEVFFTQTAARAAKLIENAEILNLENADDNMNWFDPPKLANAILDHVKRHPIAGGTAS